MHGGTSQLVSASGADLTLRLGLSLQGTFAASTKNVYLWVRDNEANDTGWVQTVTWNPYIIGASA